MKDNDFVIEVNGLALGKTEFLARANKEFFAKNENQEVLDADLEVRIIALKQRDVVDFELCAEGTVTVPCDRCLAPVEMPVSVSNSFRLRLHGSDATIEDHQEEVFLREGTDELDFGQEIYDYSLLALPLQRFHKDGGCDAAALAYLSESSDGSRPEATDSPFSALAEMLNKKQ